MAAAPRAKLERLAAPLARIDGTGDYSLTQHVQGAVDLLDQMRRSGSATVEDFLNQSNLLARQAYDPEVIELAKQLKSTNPVELTNKVRQYAEDAKYAANYEGPGLFGDRPDPKTPQQAFEDAFGVKLGERSAPAPIEAPAAPQKSADFEQSFKPAPKPTNPQDILDKLRAASKLADQFYKDERVPFSDTGIARAVKTDEPDQIVSKFIGAGKGDRAQKFYARLDAKGQAAVRYGIVASALDKATDASSGIFSPKRFVTALDKTDEAQGVFFRGKDKWELDGFANLMAHLTRAGQYAENPPTGQRLIPYLLGGGLASGVSGLVTHAGVPLGAGLAGNASAIGMIAIARLLFTTPKGRDFLLSSSSLEPGTRAMNALVSQIDSTLSRGASVTVSRGKDRVVEFPGPQGTTNPSVQTLQQSAAPGR
jgi:hypothetical protein